MTFSKNGYKKLKRNAFFFLATDIYLINDLKVRVSLAAENLENSTSLRFSFS